MKTLILAAVAVALAGCGVDGPPVAPVAATTAPGVSVSGDARIGIRADDL